MEICIRRNHLIQHTGVSICAIGFAELRFAQAKAQPKITKELFFFNR